MSFLFCPLLGAILAANIMHFSVFRNKKLLFKREKHGEDDEEEGKDMVPAESFGLEDGIPRSLEEIGSIFGDYKYIELTKTYRSSPEIIDYTNKILHLNHVNAIRKSSNKPVVFRKKYDLEKQLIEDINSLKSTYKSLAVITKDRFEAEKLYSIVKDKVDIELIVEDNSKFFKKCIIIPAYLAKGLEFDSVIVYNNRENSYKNNERNLLYVATTRAQHELYVYN